MEMLTNKFTKLVEDVQLTRDEGDAGGINLIGS